MKFLIVFAAVVACACAASLQGPGSDVNAQVTQQESEINPDGSFKNTLTVNNGISQQAAGQLKQVPGAESPSISVQGSFVQLGENGEQLTITYLADENGYQPQGPQVPVGPQ